MGRIPTLDPMMRVPVGPGPLGPIATHFQKALGGGAVVPMEGASQELIASMHQLAVALKKTAPDLRDQP